MKDNTRIWKWMVVSLVTLNIILLLTIWHSYSRHGGPPRHDGGPAKKIINDLNLSATQTAEFEKLKEQHHSSMLELQKKGRELRDEFFELLKQEHPDPTQITEKAGAIAENQKQIEMITFSHFESVRKMCSPEQKKKFDEMIGDILRKMSGPPPGEDKHP